MKKLLLLISSIVIGGTISAQSYYHYEETGTTAPYSSLATANVVLAQGSDEVLSAVQNLPFTWQFFGSNVSSYKVSDNGYITFDPLESTSISNNTTLPNATAPKNAIFAFWDELELKAISGSAVKTEARTFTYGTAPNRVHVIQWFTASKKGTAAGSTNYLYFAIRINESGNFDVVYNDASPNITGLSGTIGCQNADGTEGVMVSGPSADFPNKLGSQANATDKVRYFKFGEQPKNDIELVSLNIPRYNLINNNISVKGKIKNYGKDNLSSFRLFYSVNGGTPMSMLLSGLNINFLSTYDFTHNIPYSSSTTTNATIQVWASLPNNSADEDSTNNNQSSSFFIGGKSTPRRVLHEVFTSSTCPPCKPGNERLHQVLNQKVGNFAVVKYQYYFPGTGDPYFTLEAFNRGVYYDGVNSVPNMRIDGGWASNPGSYTTAIFDGFKETPSYVEMNCKLTVTGKDAQVAVDVKPLVSEMPEGTYKLYIALVEKNTTKNVKNNGELNFDFVMKKMLPNENGQAFTFPSMDQIKTVNANFTFPGEYRLAQSARISSNSLPTGTNYAGIDITKEHSVEKFYDLHAVAFLVREETKDVMQTAWTAQDWLIGNEENSKAIQNSFEVFPNPSNNYFTIEYKGNQNASFRLLDLNGKELISNDQINLNTEIPCSNLNSGIYFIEMNIDGKVSTKKLSIIK
jgi:hypothetical protein